MVKNLMTKPEKFSAQITLDIIIIKRITGIKNLIMNLNKLCLPP